MKFKQTLWSLCGIVMLTALATNLNAQVTIGSSKKPVDGALLDLKQFADQEAIDGGRSAEKGLGMPRVVLTDLKALTIGEAGDPNQLVIPNTNTNWADHTGLIVYNVREVNTTDVDEQCENELLTSIPKGLFVWDGTQWQPLIGEAGGEVVPPSPNYSEFVDDRDPADPQTYSAFHYKVENTASPTLFDDVGVWMLDNVRAKTFVPNADRDNTDNTISIDFDGAVPSYESSITKPIWGYPNENGETDGSKPDLYNANPELGLLYNWVAQTNNKDQTLLDYGDNALIVQGICPTGWHLPTGAEWASLVIHFMYYTDSYATGSAPLAPPGTLDDTDLSLSTKFIIGSGKLLIPTGVFTTPCAYIDESALAAGTTIEEVRGKAKPKNRGGFNVMYPGIGWSSRGTTPGISTERGFSGVYSPSNAISIWGYEAFNFLTIKGWNLALNDGNARSLMLSVRCKKNVQA